METQLEKGTPSLSEKMKTILEAVLDIEKAKDEGDACQIAILSLEELRYPLNMVSFLRTIKDERFVVGDPALASGEKWTKVADVTKRNFDNPEDILPLVLSRKKPRFVMDSTNDPQGECDEDLCRKVGIVSQYVMPLATDSMLIGTLQVDMGTRNEEPIEECAILDALAAHLSIAIERFRTIQELDQAHRDLESKSRLIAYEAAASDILHGLDHTMLNFLRELRDATINPKIRCNGDALKILEKAVAMIVKWHKDVEDSMLRHPKNEQPAHEVVLDVVKEVIGIWYRKAAIYHCLLRFVDEGSGVAVKVRRGALMELLTCLVVNAIDAEARSVTIHISRVNKNKDETGNVKSYAEIIVSDDGMGIPQEHQKEIMQFGWTSKARRGHGMGMTIVLLLTKEMNGEFKILSFGKGSGQKTTEMQLLIPIDQD